MALGVSRGRRVDLLECEKYEKCRKGVKVVGMRAVSYPFGKEPNQKKYLSATVQSLERNATQLFDIV